MLRIRFHGRGGQGMKTASRILGSAAFHAGLVVQDSPVYGAERPGTPMAAFTRIAREPILERGAIRGLVVPAGAGVEGRAPGNDRLRDYAQAAIISQEILTR